MTITSAPVTTMPARPRYDAANIRTWIGFKQFLALAEEAVLAWFREQGYGPQWLYHHYGVGIEIVDSSALLPAVLEVDDEVVASVQPVRPGRFSVVLTARRGTGSSVVFKGKVGCRADPGTRRAGPRPGAGRAAGPGPPGGRRRQPRCGRGGRRRHRRRPALELARAVLPLPLLRPGPALRLRARAGRGGRPVPRLTAGCPWARMLDERGWIPVVSRARVRLLADARMEEYVHTTFAVSDVVKDVTWEGRMDCHVQRGADTIRVATATDPARLRGQPRPGGRPAGPSWTPRRSPPSPGSRTREARTAGCTSPSAAPSAG